MNKNLKNKKVKSKTNKGITLIALIITIIVLLILAIVAIRAVTGDGILAHAKNARDKWDEATAEEEAMLGNLTNYITDQSGNNLPAGETYVKVYKDTPAPDNGTINGEKPNADNPIIPKGFIPLDQTDGTSNWGDGNSVPNAQSVKNGLVITDNLDDGNEFVWIPVKNINDMVMCQEHREATLEPTTLECPECKAVDKPTVLAGKLYATKVSSYSASFGSPNTSYGKNTGFREPDVVTSASGEDSTAGSNFDADEDNLERVLDEAHLGTKTAANFKDQLQKEFEKMEKSVAKYKGFYVGRYEMSEKGGSKKEGISLQNTTSDNNWYGLYSKAKKFELENDAKSKVTIEMIWGCQWDAMMRWMQENDIDVTKTVEEGIKDTGRENKEGVSSKVSINTGTITGREVGDRLNNVFDLLGNRIEWTQETLDARYRVMRGGYFYVSFSPSIRRNDNVPVCVDGNYGSWGSRLSLYVK